MTQRASAWLEALGALFRSIEATDAIGLSLSLDDAAERAAERLVAVAGTGNKVMLVGNGGSAAIAQHAHNDLAKSARLRAQVFYDAPLATAITNDDGYAEVFEQPIARWADRGDVLVAISSSGRSENILRAAKAAQERGVDVVSLTGFEPDNPLRAAGLINFWVPSRRYGPVEAAHTALMHFLTDRATQRRGS